jgi:hypothetical protein
MSGEKGYDMGLFCGLIISEARGVLRIKMHGYLKRDQKGSDEASGTIVYHERLTGFD